MDIVHRSVMFPQTWSRKYVIYNNGLNHALERKKDVCGTTTNKEANYIALVEGLKEAKT